MWEDYEPSIKVMDFLDINKEILRRYKKNDRIDSGLDDYSYTSMLTLEDDTPRLAEPQIPFHIHMRSYQLEAIQEWKKHDYVGIFDMATGTEKTYIPTC